MKQTDRVDIPKDNLYSSLFEINTSSTRRLIRAFVAYRKFQLNVNKSSLTRWWRRQ